MIERRFFCLRGFMKSGTNWLSSLLSSHQDIGCYGEYHWQSMVEELETKFATLPIYQDLNFRKQIRVTFEDMIKQCLILKDSKSTVLGERTPTTLAPFVMSNVPHISIIRDGRDVLVSRAFHLHNEPDVHRLFERIPEMAEQNKHFRKNPWYFRDNPTELLKHEMMVRESVQWWQQHLEQDRNTCKRHPEVPVKFVHYEALHQDTEKYRRELFEFLDVDPKCCAKIKGVLKAGFSKEDPRQFLRKGQVGDWKNYFTEDTKNWFKDVAGDELILQGYEDSMDW